MRTTFLFPGVSLTLLLSCSQPQKPDPAVQIAAVEQGLLPGLLVEGESIPHYTLQTRMAHYDVPGLSVAVVEGGRLLWAKGYGLANTQTGKAVDTATLFQAGSISKPVAALQLWEQGKVDLDADVNTYLRGWKVPDSPFTDSAKVTLRLLLTHSAGMTVHGFPGYAQTDTFPDITAVLEGRGNTAPIVVDTVPGSLWRYSGGGYTVMEKVVEDVSGMPLEEYMARHIFPQLGMSHSTYQEPLQAPYTENASAAYNGKGELVEGLWHNYPEQAAAGLWTTPSDLAAYCIAIQEILAGKREGPISRATARAMLTPHLNQWGLGPATNKEGDSLRFSHGGKNEGFTNNMLATAYQGTAVIVMTSADRGGGLISEIERAVSDVYGWGLTESPRTVRLANLSPDSLQGYAGRYLLDFQVPEIGDYWVTVTVEGNQLRVDDPNNGQSDLLSPLDSVNFLNLETGDDVAFSAGKDSLEMVFLKRFRFVRQAPRTED